jgi:hypothetical protein
LLPKADHNSLVMQLTLWVHLKDRSKSSATRCAMLGLELGINENDPYRNGENWGKSVLTEFESEMLERSATKVKHSAEAAQFLHSEIVLHEGDEPRGRCLTRKRG